MDNEKMVFVKIVGSVFFVSDWLIGLIYKQKFNVLS